MPAPGMHSGNPTDDALNLAMSEHAVPLFEQVKAFIANEVEPITDDELEDFMSQFPCRPIESFIGIYNESHPYIPEIEARLAEAKSWRSPSGDSKWEHARVRKIEKELHEKVDRLPKRGRRRGPGGRRGARAWRSPRRSGSPRAGC